MSQTEREQLESAMAREETMQMHRRNIEAADRAREHRDRARLVETVVDSELESHHDRGGGHPLENFNAKDFPLSNFKEDVGKTEVKWTQEIANLFAKAPYPHPQSGLQGLARAWATGDPTDRRRSPELDEIVADESLMLGNYARATRGEGMMQQEVISKSVQESVAIHDNNWHSDGGLLSWFRE